MSISKEQLKKYRELAENTTMISALGEYTPLEFIELLDYIEELEAQLTKCAVDAACACAEPKPELRYFDMLLCSVCKSPRR